MKLVIEIAGFCPMFDLKFRYKNRNLRVVAEQDRWCSTT